MKPNSPSRIIGLDVGGRRIGVALGDTLTRIATPHTTLDVDGHELERLKAVVAEQDAGIIVVGLPRNQQGEETAQSQAAREFAGRLEELGFPVVFQDESLTSVLAEKHLSGLKKPYAKADIDKYAAAIILEDYLETHYGHQAA